MRIGIGDGHGYEGVREAGRGLKTLTAVGEVEAFNVEIEAVAGPSGPEPGAFRLRGRTWRVAAVLDRWHGRGYRYVKVRTEGGETAILRHDEAAGVWTLTLLDAWPAGC